MKTDRLIGILSVLLQSEQTTAVELSQLFEVSRRTINRDIEDLCKAGIPIMTIQGANGGIRIMDGYRIDRTILSSKDMRMILTGLRSLDSVSGSNYCTLLMEKLQLGSSRFVSGRDSILIDLSSWQGKSLISKIEIIQNAIENRLLLDFDYYAPTGESRRFVEPYYLIFRWSSWYLYAWCKDREDFRLFKLNRMRKVNENKESFVSRQVELPDLGDEKIFPEKITVKVLFDESEGWRLNEEFGEHSYTRTAEGKLLFSGDYSDFNSMLTWFLTFGDKVEVLEPPELRNRIMETIRNMKEKYEEH